MIGIILAFFCVVSPVLDFPRPDFPRPDFPRPEGCDGAESPGGHDSAAETAVGRCDGAAESPEDDGAESPGGHDSAAETAVGRCDGAAETL